MLKADFLLTWPNKNPMNLSCPRHVHVQPIPYVLSLMCVPYKDFFSHIMALSLGICVTLTYF